MSQRPVYPPYEHSYPVIGCWPPLLAIAVAGGLFAFSRPAWTPLAVLLSIPLVLLARDHLGDWRAVRRTRVLRERGVKGLLVYSRSPNWQPYIEEKWFPVIRDSVEILDWSDRREWQKDDVRVQIFRGLVESDENSNPAAVVFRRRGKPLVFRFYPAFRNAKHGNTDGLRMLEEAFLDALQQED